MKSTDLVKQFLKRRKKSLILYIIVSILYYPLQTITFTVILSKLFDNLNNYKRNKDDIYKIILSISVLYAIINFSIISKEKIESYLIPEFTKDIRVMIFDNIIEKMRIKFKDIDIGEFISRISMITLKWDEVIQYCASIIFPYSLTLIVIIGCLIYYGPKFGLLTVIYIFGVFILLLPRYKKCLNSLIKLRYDLNSRHNDIQDKLNNLFDIYISNNEKNEMNKNKGKEGGYQNNYENVLKCNLSNSALISIFNVIYLITMLYLVINNLYSNKISKGTTISIILLVTYIIAIVDHIFKSVINASYSYSVLKESENFLNYISTYELSKTGKKVNINSNIEFRNVIFKYKQDIVLNNINLEIKNNDKIIIKGRSGSGKSTLVKLLCGFYSPTSGLITIDNTPIENINIENLRNQVGMLNQNVKLFNISIYDNIRYGNKNLSKSTIDKFISKYGINLYNDLKLTQSAGQNGNNLSGGQKQMTLIIRTVLLDKNLLIFDEPTSALDNYHFEVFNKILLKLKKTVIVITHDSRFDKTNFTNRYHLDKGNLKKIS